MKIVVADLNRCVGCRNCEWACAFSRTGDFQSDQSNITVQLYPEDRFVTTLTCVHCETPVCVQICPQRALKRDPRTNAVVLVEERCIGCRMCLQVCPFGNIYMDPGKRIVHKCNLCEGEPQCIRFCMTKALDFVEIKDLPLKRRRAVDQWLRKSGGIAPGGER
jgi:carbon-monoxide dehydrogenase iron sulfur subunit